ETANEALPGLPPPVLYDADAKQQFTFRQYDDEGEFDVTHTYGALTDEALIEYDETRLVLLRQAETKSETTCATDSLAAAEILFDRICESVDGYGEPGAAPPDNWKELITPDEKLQGI